jgi:chromosome partitioning protein
LSLFAHGLADTLITPINDSFVDLDVIYTPGVGDEGPSPSRYARTVGAALEARRRVTKERTDWVVVRNRLSPLGSRNERDVGRALESIADKAGFRITTGLLERVVYREFFPIGLTAFDSLEASLLDVKPSMSHLLARQEVRTLISSFNLLPEAEDMTEPKHDILATTVAPELAASKPTPPIKQVMRALLDSISET